MSISIDGIIFSLQRHGGISVYFRELLRFLAARDVQTELTLEKPLEQSDFPTVSSIVMREARRLERFRAARISDAARVFHSSYYRQPARRKVPTVVTVHDFIYERVRRGPARWSHVAQKHAAIRAAQAVICISEATRQEMLHWVGEVPGQRVHVIHHGVSPNFHRLPDGGAERGGAPFALFIGPRKLYKNFQLALRALALLPDIELHCVGGGPIDASELSAVPTAVARRVRHLGYVDDATLNERYNRATCLLYPSSLEGFGIPVIEAMRAGCPVVCIDCAAVLEIGGDALAVAQAAEPEALAAAVRRTLDPTERALLSQAGLRVAQRYDWTQTHERTLAVYRELGL
jgi:mannosyltransferase